MQHNILTLRGAPVRDSLAWSKDINEAMYTFGNEAEVMFASHSWRLSSSKQGAHHNVVHPDDGASW